MRCGSRSSVTGIPILLLAPCNGAGGGAGPGPRSSCSRVVLELDVGDDADRDAVELDRAAGVEAADRAAELDQVRHPLGDDRLVDLAPALEQVEPAPGRRLLAGRLDARRVERDPAGEDALQRF